MRHLLLLIAIAATSSIVTAPSSASAGDHHPFDTRSDRGNDHANGPKPRHVAYSVPEFDPATAGAIAAVLAGGGVLIARRRKR